MKKKPEPKSCCDGPQKPAVNSFLLQPIFLITAALAAGVFSSQFVPLLIPFRETLVTFFRMMFWPLVLGFILGAVIDAFVPSEYISKYLAKKRSSTVFYAAILGFLMSACNHGILALSMALHRKGASGAAVVSFLLASPWANLPVTFLLLGFFGWKGLLVIFLALLIAIITGLVFQRLEVMGWVEKNPHQAQVPSDFSIQADLRSRLSGVRWSPGFLAGCFGRAARSAAGLANMVLFWILLGVFIAAAAAAVIPHGWFEKFLGPDLPGLMVTLFFASILEICSEGTSPLAFTIYQKTGAFGNAFAFLMAGVVTDYTEIGLVWKNLGKRSALWMLLISLSQVILAAILLNRVFAS
ncbi:MAG: hypothetical protein FGM27_07375 [Candidatus Omnitrophica bacterium]|nr:hypothetical protein [Candidatus Omnitrophota bacterium]